jgi:hypothetical protein
MASRSLHALADRLRDVDDLMDAHAHVQAAHAPHDPDYELDGMNRAAILMLSAHFEGYLEELMRESLAAIDPQLDADPLLRGFGNPWPNRIDELFSFLGMRQPSHRISWEDASSTHVRERLEHLVRVRNQVAHGQIDVVVYRRDVTDLRGCVEGFARGMDAAVHAHLTTLTGAAPWAAPA